jgi:hypothetical protein
MVDDFARLDPDDFRAKYAVETLGAGWDRIVAAAHRVVLTGGGDVPGRVSPRDQEVPALSGEKDDGLG